MSTTAFPVNPQLTAIAMAYRNPAVSLIADKVLPRVLTAKKFKYTVYDAEQGYTIPSTLVGRKSEPTQVDFQGTAVANPHDVPYHLWTGGADSDVNGCADCSKGARDEKCNDVFNGFVRKFNVRPDGLGR